MNFGKQFKEGLITQNPVLVQLLGMFSTMAITTSFFNGLGMGLSVTLILICSNVLISLLRKGIIDIPLMILFNSIWGVDGIAVAIPVSDFIALVVAVILVLPYLKEISGTALPLDETAGNLPHRN